MRHEQADTSSPRPPNLGIASISMALLTVLMLSGFAGVTVVRRYGYIATSITRGENALVLYLCADLLLIGLVLGAEGIRRPASPKLPAIVGTVMNASLLLSMPTISFLFNLLPVPIDY